MCGELKQETHQRDALGLRGDKDDEEGHHKHPGGKEEENAPLLGTQPISVSN